MQRRVKKEQVILVESDELVCDLCEKVIEPGTMLTLEGLASRPNGRVTRFDLEGSKLDICTPECLTKNVGAVSLLFNTKVLPEIKTKSGVAEDMYKELTKESDDYVKYRAVGKFGMLRRKRVLGIK